MKVSDLLTHEAGNRKRMPQHQVGWLVLEDSATQEGKLTEARAAVRETETTTEVGGLSMQSICCQYFEGFCAFAVGHTLI